jgi:hypothetical protein
MFNPRWPNLWARAHRPRKILPRRRALTVDMIHEIGKAWRIPADLLVRPCAIKPHGVVQKS